MHHKLIITLLALLPALSWALPSDREQPIEIEADHAQIDDQQGITQYKGKAILTQGSLRIEGDIITFYYDKDKQLTKVVIQGKFATFKQTQKVGEKPIRARALKIEYHAKAEKIYLLGKGHVWQNDSEFSGNRIEYDMAKNIVNASGGTSAGATPKKGERIHIIIQPPGGKKTSNISKPTIAPTVESKPAVEKPKDDIYPTATPISPLNVRTGPGTQYSKIGALESASELTILTEQKNWVQIRGVISGQAVIGWVNRRYIRMN